MSKLLLLPVVILSIAVSIGAFYVRLQYARKERPRAVSVITCSDIYRRRSLCEKLPKPVCGKVNVQCIKALCEPVEQTFADVCEACGNPLIESYGYGACK